MDAFASTAIPFDHLEELVREQGVSFRAGDILFLRAGFTTAYDALSAEEQRVLPERPAPDFLGVEPSARTLRWLWESGFAAVATDTPSFEQAPVAGPHTETGGVWKGEPWEEVLQGGGLLHQWLLGGWGMPIGEMFDLEALARKCKEQGRWTFFVSSVPLKVRRPCSSGQGGILTGRSGPGRRGQPAECCGYLLRVLRWLYACASEEARPQPLRTYPSPTALLWQAWHLSDPNMPSIWPV